MARVEAPTRCYRLLGPVEAQIGVQPVPLPGPRARTLLATLLLDAGRVVPVDRLIDLLWDDAPPRTAVTALQGLVSHLRRALCADRESGTPIQFRPPGYAIVVAPGELDLHEFERLVELAHQSMSTGNAATAARQLREALALWRGPALGGVTAEALRQVELPRLEELHLDALEERIDADLRLSRHRSLIAELRSLVGVHPYREQLTRQLMLALYRSGRQAEALDVFRDARRRAVDELGLDPGPELEQLERAILRRDPSLDPVRPEPVPEAAISGMPRPSGLPAAVADFTGRAQLVGDLCRLLVRGPEVARAAPAVVALSGQPGVGKTTLAVEAAHRLRDRFPDGQLFVQLGGAGKAPVEPAEVLGGWLRELGVPPTAIPDSLDGRARLYRGCLAPRRMLVVLDDAGSESAVRSLLPAGPGCSVLVTSRVRLAGLEGVTFVEVGVLAPEEAISLLRRIVGEERVAAEPDAAGTVVSACGLLPLAVRIAGARLAVRPGWPLTALADRLRSPHRSLDELQAGDLGVRSSLDLSYGALDEPARWGLRLLTALDVRDFTAAGAGALLGMHRSEAEKVLERLADRHLLETSRPDPAGHVRYHFHDLLRAYATERRECEDQAESVMKARRAAIHAYAAEAEAAARRLGGHIPPLPVGRLEPELQSPADSPIDRRDGEAVAWFEAERQNLVAVIEQAARTGMPDLAWRLTTDLTPFYHLRSLWDEWHRTHLVALEAAADAGDHMGRGAVLISLGHLEEVRCRHELALGHFEAARREFELIDYRLGQGAAALGIGIARWQAGELEESIRCFQSSLSIVRPWPMAEAVVQGYHSRALTDRGELDLAEAAVHRLLDIAKVGNLRRGEGFGMMCLGIVTLERDWPEQAARHFEAGLALLAGSGDRLTEAHMTCGLGTARAAQGQPAAAATHLERAQAVYRELGERVGEASTLHGLGMIAYREGRFADARRYLEQALLLFDELHQPRGVAATLHAQGVLELSAGRSGMAVELLRETVRLYAEQGCRLREARVRRHLTMALRGTAKSSFEQSAALSSLTVWHV